MTHSNQDASNQDAKIVDQVLQQPLLLQRLTDRVYQLLVNDLVTQRDRTPK